MASVNRQPFRLVRFTLNMGRWVLCSRKSVYILIVILVLFMFGFILQKKSHYFYWPSAVHFNISDCPVFEDKLSDTSVNNDSQGQPPVDNGELRIQARLKIAREKCEEYSSQQNWTTMQIFGYAWTYKAKNLVYCVTPKVGCTFWKRVFRFLNHDYQGKASSPADIDRMYVHYGRLKNTKVHSLKNPVQRTLLGSQNSFMFSRDPYSRLWSAYIDKFFLPDFWRSEAKQIVTTVRKNASARDKRCPKNISFEEFLLYVTIIGKRGGNMNEHFIPVYRLCNPCLMNFDVIGKQESFGSDAEYILERNGIDYIMENYSLANRISEELHTLIDYNFALDKHIAKDCFDKVEVAGRLWLAFKINGYIPRSASFPEDAIKRSNNTKDAFTELVFRTHQEHKSEKSWKNQRREMLVDGYSSVPRSVMEDLVSIYKPDFELFDYEPRPSDIFRLSTSSTGALKASNEKMKL